MYIANIYCGNCWWKRFTNEKVMKSQKITDKLCGDLIDLKPISFKNGMMR